MKKSIFLLWCFFAASISYGQWSTSGSHIYNSNGGNVGIGTNSPATKLDILGGDVTSSLRLQLKHASSNIFLQQYVDNSAAEIITGNNHFYIENYGGIRMTVLANGKIGMGTTSPDATLSVYTGPGSQLNVVNGGNNLLELGNYSSAAGYRHLYLAGSPLSFHTAIAGGTTCTERMRILDNGNVGIGVTNPAEKLSVLGNISANGFIYAKKMTVTQSGWSDYVFEPSYYLTPLSTLEKYIKKNKHLPEVPSAKEVEENGINIGDTQALLLKKIEELTLYLIEQDKKIERVIKENHELKRTIKSKK